MAQQSPQWLLVIESVNDGIHKEPFLFHELQQGWQLCMVNSDRNPLRKRTVIAVEIAQGPQNGQQERGMKLQFVGGFLIITQSSDEKE